MSKYCSTNDLQNLQSVSYAENSDPATRTLDIRGRNECVRKNRIVRSCSQLLADSEANTKDDVRTDRESSEWRANSHP